MDLRKSMILGGWVLSMGLGCSPIEPEVTGGSSGTEDGSGTASDDSEPSVPANPSASDTGMSADGTSADSAMGTDSTSSSTGEPPTDTTTEDCPLGTEGCSCDDEEGCDEGLECSDAGTCETPPPCMSIDAEIHDDEATATPLTELDCGNTSDLGLIGTIDGTETDWYTFYGNHEFIGCNERPGAAVDSDVPLEVCVFISCDSGNRQSIECDGGNTTEMSPEGRPGCCGTDSAGMEDYGCSSLTNDDVFVWISVTSEAPVCANYGLSYDF